MALSAARSSARRSSEIDASSALAAIPTSLAAPDSPAATVSGAPQRLAGSVARWGEGSGVTSKVEQRNLLSEKPEVAELAEPRCRMNGWPSSLRAEGRSFGS